MVTWTEHHGSRSIRQLKSFISWQPGSRGRCHTGSGQGKMHSQWVTHFFQLAVLLWLLSPPPQSTISFEVFEGLEISLILRETQGIHQSPKLFLIQSGWLSRQLLQSSTEREPNLSLVKIEPSFSSQGHQKSSRGQGRDNTLSHWSKKWAKHTQRIFSLLPRWMLFHLQNDQEG